MILRLDKSILSRNAIDKLHWSTRAKHRKEWEEAIWAECNGRPPKTTRKIQLIITSIRSRLLDKDNLWGGCKQLIDSMVRLGIIKDDSENWLDLEIRQIKVQSRNAGQTVLEWQESLL